MEKAITERYNPSVSARALELFGGADPEELGGFESYIIGYTAPEGERILRISHSLRRSREMILAELQWIRYLGEQGISVADCVPSASGNQVEAIPDDAGGEFLVSSFRRIHGETPWKYGWSPEMNHRYGELLGRMQRATVNYSPSGKPRPQWNSRELTGDLLSMIPVEDTAVAGRIRELEAEALKLPADASSFGLVHYDAHRGNMLVDHRGSISLFDFDDCCYSWFACDIAIVLFYMVTCHPEPERVAEEFLKDFLSGYAREFSLDPEWLQTIPLFLSIREADLYAVIHRSMDIDALTGWCAAFMDNRREKISSGEPYLKMDFASFAGLL